MKMKKLVSIALAALLTATAFAGCGNKATTSSTAKKATDSDYIKDKGKLVVGITDFAPMDYKEKGSDEWVGFDADMAKEFAKSLDVEVEFIEINWDKKVMELDGKTIDCVWNGMTLTDEVKSAMATTKAYCNNAQIVIVNKDVADKYQDAASCKDLKFAVEAGSAGEQAAKDNKFDYTPVEKQSDALMEVAAGTSDAAIIDSLMAAAMVGEGTGYQDLTYTAKLTTEEYGAGFRKGSDLAEKFNAFFDSAVKDGTAEKIAEKYGIQAALIK